MATEDDLLRSVAAQNARSIQEARRQTERELVEERERLRITLASIGDGVISTDAAGRVAFLNGVAESLTGWPLADAHGRPLEEIFRIVHEHTREPVDNPALRALREGRVVALANHTVLIARDGAERPIEDTAAPMRDETGAAVGAVLVFRDVTDRRRAAETQARLAAIVESSDDAIVSKTLDGIIRSWNAGAERVFGYTAAEAVGRHITLLIPPDRIDEEQEIIGRLRRGERVDHFETVRVTRDGRLLDISLTVSPVRDGSGQVVGASKVARDITARKAAEEALRDEHRVVETLNAIGQRLSAELDLQRLLQAVTDEATSLTGAAFGAFFYNAVDARGESYQLYTLAGVPREAFAGFPMPRNTEIFEPTFRGLGTVRLPDVTQDPRYGRSAPYYGMPAGHLPVRSYLAIPVKSRSGDVLGGLFFGHADVGVFTERHERLVVGVAAQAAIAIDNARLYEQLQDQDKRKDDFLALLAHELRNPLAPLRNGLQALALAGDNPVAVGQVREMMDRQLNNLIRLVDDLLDVSRITRNKMELRLARVHLADVVRTAVETARPPIDAAGHELTVALPPGPVELDADPVRLAQVFSNLLTNSAKYTGGGGRITLSASVRSEELGVRSEDPNSSLLTPHSSLVEVEVTDTGIGIPADALPRIFDMFSQVDRSDEKSSGGLGIGLALVKGLTEMHGGTVAAASPGPGRGSTFTVRLPLPTGAAAPAEPAPAAPSRPVARKRRVLVADDNRDGADSMATMLGLLGDEVHTARDGFEAVALAQRLLPDVVLMDVGMPRMNGLDATRRIREQPWGRGMIVIAVTGWGQAEDRDRTKEAGFDGHLVKPVSLPDLERLMGELRPGS